MVWIGAEKTELEIIRFQPVQYIDSRSDKEWLVGSDTKSRCGK